MLCFRDMTFCTASRDGGCANTACRRYFDDDDKAAADQWWGREGAPIAWGDFREGCTAIIVPNPHTDEVEPRENGDDGFDPERNADLVGGE